LFKYIFVERNANYNYHCAMNNPISIFVITFILISSNSTLAQGVDQQNLIKAPGVFNFNTASSIRGNRTRIEYDNDGDGTADEITTFTYDANGNQTRIGYDNDGDGTVDQITTYTYDANGNITRQETDSDGDGTVDEIRTYTYDANGNQTRYDRDRGGDGTVDAVTTFIYDANGNQTRIETDRDGDGTVDEITTFTYDANGNQTRYEYDSDGDGTADEITTSTYDANGNMIRYEYDFDGDGTADEITTYTYDANGNITRQETDRGGDGMVDEITTSTYDANGNMTRYERDSDRDGTADQIITYTYDANGNMTRYERDFDGDGMVDEITTFTYDANGNETRQERKQNGVINYIGKKSFFNSVLCPDLGEGLVHKLQVVIPESGVWRFALCGSTFQNVLALSSSDYCDSTLFYASDGCSNGDASVDIRLEQEGTYYLTVAGKGETDKGDYNLEVTRLQGLDAPSIEKEMISVYPNPARNQITVSSSITVGSYRIFNTLGEQVLNGNLISPSINIEALNSGSYFLMLEDKNSNQTYHKKFIK
jgi:YD repeat-containing protein